MKIIWNTERQGFQECWLWQFGEGPFEVLQEYQIPTEPTLMGIDFLRNRIEMIFEPGRWLMISISNAEHQYRVEYGVHQVMFHEKYFRPFA